MYSPTNAPTTSSEIDYPVEVIDLDRMNALAGKMDVAGLPKAGSSSAASSIPSTQTTYETSPMNTRSDHSVTISPSGVRIVQLPTIHNGRGRPSHRGRPRNTSLTPGRVVELRADPSVAERDLKHLKDTFEYVSIATIHRVYMSCLQRLDLSSKELARINELEKRKHNVSVVPEPYTLRPLMKMDADTTGMSKRVLLLDPTKTRNVKPSIGGERCVKDEDVTDTETRIQEFMAKSCVCIVPTDVEVMDHFLSQSASPSGSVLRSTSAPRGRPRKNPNPPPHPYFSPSGTTRASDVEDRKPINLLAIARQGIIMGSDHERVLHPPSVPHESEDRAVSEECTDQVSANEDSMVKDATFEVVNDPVALSMPSSSTATPANGNDKKFFKHRRRVATDTPPSDGAAKDKVNVPESPVVESSSADANKKVNESSNLVPAPTTSTFTASLPSLTCDALTPLEYFNHTAVEELCLVPTCTLKKAELISNLRPFRTEEDFTARVGTGLVTCSSPSTSSGSTKNGTSGMSSGMCLANAKALWQGCQELLNLRATIQKLLHRCEQYVLKHNSQEELDILCRLTAEVELSEELEQFIERLTATSNNGQAFITKQPSSLNPKLKLKPYQLIGLNWLHQLHSRNLNGILADEMGLGKTIQSIAFLAYLVESRGDRGPHLVIVPTSTLRNWANEFQQWCPSLKVVLYAGTQEERKQLRMRIYDGSLSDFHVVLTSYHIATGSIEDRSLMKRITFHCGIFDEAHMLKNMLSQRYRSFMNFAVQKRFLLTGTPLQNSITELFSLLAFIMPDLFGQYLDTLKKLFNHYTRASMELNLSKQSDRPLGAFQLAKINHVRTMLKPFLLRRLKSQVLSQLPAKIVEVVHAEMDEKQQTLYDEEFTNLKESINQGPLDDGESVSLEQPASKRSRATEQANNPDSAAGLKGKSLAKLMRLRKVANHPLLLPRAYYTEKQLEQIARILVKQDPGHALANVDLVKADLMSLPSDMNIHLICRHHANILSQFLIPEEVLVNSGKLRYLDQLLPIALKSGERVLVFSQFLTMLDLLEEYFRIRGYAFLRLDGTTPSAERQQLIDQFNQAKDGESSPFIFLLSTRAGGLGINLSSANVVIIHDVDFNPQADKQAEDRAHRVGQTRDVRVYRLIMKNTVEQTIFESANQKLKLGEVVTSVNEDVMDEEDEMAQKSTSEDGTSAQSRFPTRKRARATDSSQVKKGLQDRVRLEDEEPLPAGESVLTVVNAREVLTKLFSSS